MLRDLPPSGWALALILAYATCTVFVPAEWPLQSFHIAAFALLAISMIAADRGAPSWRGALENWYIVIPLFGVVQLVTGATVSAAETRAGVLHWSALVAVFYLARRVTRDRHARHVFLSAFLWFAVILSVVTLLTLYTSPGKVLWWFNASTPEVVGVAVAPVATRPNRRPDRSFSAR